MSEGDYENYSGSESVYGGDSQMERAAAAAAAQSSSSSSSSSRGGLPPRQPKTKARGSKRLRGEDLSVGHVNIQDQQDMVSAIKEGAFYKEKQRDAWIGGMTTAFVLFVGFAIGGFFFYKSKINTVVSNAVGGKLSDEEQKKLKEDIGSFDAVQMLWYLGWGVFSFLIGYAIYFFTIRNWRRRQMAITKQLAQTSDTELASRGRYRSTAQRGEGGPLGPSGSYTEASRTLGGF